MTALSEALLTAQRGALAAIEKFYLRGGYEDDADVIDDCKSIGCTDASDLALFLNTLRLRYRFGLELGATNGTAPKPPAEDEPASEAQWKLLRKLADENGRMAPDPPLTKGEASRHIDALKSGAPF